MCNPYRLSKPASDLANLFKAPNEASGANVGVEVYPGYPGLVIAEGAVRSMVWGFPLSLKSKKTGKPLKPKPVNNTRTDKLNSFMWRYSCAERRCLIPLNAWAEAEGAKGAMMRTWMRMAERDVFAVAGIWLESDEWGSCYSMIMTDAGGPAAQVHDRMPVLLREDEYDQWQNGSPDQAKLLCRPWTDALVIDRTDELWRR